MDEMNVITCPNDLVIQNYWYTLIKENYTTFRYTSLFLNDLNEMNTVIIKQDDRGHFPSFLFFFGNWKWRDRRVR